MPITTIQKLGSVGTLAILLVSPGFAGPQDDGLWSQNFESNWPVTAQNVLLSPQGNVLTFGIRVSDSINPPFRDVWNPELGTGSNSHNSRALPSDNIQGSSAVLLPETGNVLIAGGRSAAINESNATYIFNTQSRTTERFGNLQTSRANATTVVLPSGEILISDESLSALPEVYSSADNRWRTLTDATFDIFSWVVPNGKVISGASLNTMFTSLYLDPSGDGSTTRIEQTNIPYPGHNLMYRPGKGLLPSGNLLNSSGLPSSSVSTFNETEVWTRKVNPTRPYSMRRTRHGIMLPTGNVLSVGDFTTDINAPGVTPRLEIWNASTESWSLMANTTFTDADQFPVLMLLKDGRVLVLNNALDHEARTFSPPYLFDDSGSLAQRPEILSAPAQGAYAGQVAVTHETGDVISRVTLVSAGRFRSSILGNSGSNKGQRFFDLDFDDAANGVNVKLPESANIAPPGYYIMYLIDNKGVPSEGHMISLTASNQSYPIATADYVTATGSSAITIDALANDTGSGLTLNAPNIWSLKGGNVDLVDNKLTYKPKAGFNGEDKIWYTMADSQGRTTSGEITITVSGNGNSNPYPTATADIVSTSGSGSITIDALANDTGSGLTLNVPNVWSLKGGNVALANNKITYKPKAGFNGEDKIWYTFSDNQDRVNNGVIIITVSGNNGSSSPYPTSAQDNVTTTTATSVTIDVLANDTGDGLVLNAPNAWSLSGGKVLLNSNKLVYQSKAGFTGSDKIWYTFKDAQGRSNSGQVNITVTSGSNTGFPAAKPDYYSTSKNTGKNLNILANDTGSGWKAIDTLYQYTAKGGTTYKTPEGQVWYTPKTGFTGEDNFWYVMIDSEGRKNSAQVKITVN